MSDPWAPPSGSPEPPQDGWGAPPPPGWQASPPPQAAWQPPPTPYVDGRVPGTVMAAAIISGVGSGLTLLLLVLVAVAFQLLFGPILDDFGGDFSDLTGGVLAVLVVLALMCFAGLALARQLVRRSKVARWGLIVLSAITLVLGAVTALGVGVTVLHAIAGVAVIVLLLLPESARWFDSPA